MGPDGNSLIQISIGSPLGCCEKSTNGSIDEPGDQETQEKAEQDDTDDSCRDHLSVYLGPLLFKLFEADRGVQNAEDIQIFGMARVTGGFIIDGVDQSEEALLFG